MTKPIADGAPVEAAPWEPSAGDLPDLGLLLTRLRMMQADRLPSRDELGNDPRAVAKFNPRARREYLFRVHGGSRGWSELRHAAELEIVELNDKFAMMEGLPYAELERRHNLSIVVRMLREMGDDVSLGSVEQELRDLVPEPLRHRLASLRRVCHALQKPPQINDDELSAIGGRRPQTLDERSLSEWQAFAAQAAARLAALDAHLQTDTWDELSILMCDDALQPAVLDAGEQK
jgi:hypothetical protein